MAESRMTSPLSGHLSGMASGILYEQRLQEYYRKRKQILDELNALSNIVDLGIDLPPPFDINILNRFITHGRQFLNAIETNRNYSSSNFTEGERLQKCISLLDSTIKVMHPLQIKQVENLAISQIKKNTRINRCTHTRRP